MPLYEYLCQDCSSEQELLVGSGETPNCPKCGSQRLTKLLSVVAAPGREGSAETSSSGGQSCGAHCGCHPRG